MCIPAWAVCLMFEWMFPSRFAECLALVELYQAVLEVLSLW